MVHLLSPGFPCSPSSQFLDLPLLLPSPLPLLFLFCAQGWCFALAQWSHQNPTEPEPVPGSCDAHKHGHATGTEDCDPGWEWTGLEKVALQGLWAPEPHHYCMDAEQLWPSFPREDDWPQVMSGFGRQRCQWLGIYLQQIENTLMTISITVIKRVQCCFHVSLKSRDLIQLHNS